MIRQETVLKVADNSGAKKLLCIRVAGCSSRSFGRVGDIIVASVKDLSRWYVKKKKWSRLLSFAPPKKPAVLMAVSSSSTTTQP